MSSSEIHLIEYEFKSRNPRATSHEVSENLFQRLFQSLVSTGASRLLGNLHQSVDPALVSEGARTHERRTNVQRQVRPRVATGVESSTRQTQNSEEENFRSLTDGVLKASSSRDGVRFLRQVQDFCIENDSRDGTDDTGALLWQHLRSIKDEDGYSPLHRAVILGLRQVVKVLVIPCSDSTAEKSPELPAGDPHEFAHFCVGAWPRGHFLEFADFDILHSRTPEGWTPLHFAAISNPCDGPAAVESASKQPLVKNSYKPIGRGLKDDAGAAAEVPGENDVLDILLMMYENIKRPHDEVWDFADNFWMTPLHYAVLCNRQAQVKQLLGSEAYGRHVNAGDYHRKTPLHMAVCHREPLRLTRCLHDYWGMEDSSGPHCSIGLVKSLAESSKVDVHAADCCSYTPLHWAIQVGDLDVVRCLLSLNNGKLVRATQKDSMGRTVMQVATERAEMEAKAAISDRHCEKDFDWSGSGHSKQKSNSISTLSGKLKKKRVGNRNVYDDIQWELLSCEDVRFDLERLQREKQGLVDGTNAMIVASALVAGAAYQGLLQPPPGDGSARGDRDLKQFLWYDTLSFCFSIAALMSGVAAVFPSESRVYSWLSLLGHVRVMMFTCGFLITSILFALLAFNYGGYIYAQLVPDFHQMNLTYAGAFICLPVVAWSYVSSIFRLSSYIRRLARNSKFREAISRCKELLIHMIWDPDAIIKRKLKASWIRSRDQPHWAGERQEDSAQIESVLDRSFKFSHRGSERERPLDVLKKVYEEVRKEMYTRSRQKSENMRFVSDSGVIPREIHFWMSRCPLDRCRAHSLKVDRERWSWIVESVSAQVEKFRVKEAFDESQKFHSDHWR